MAYVVATEQPPDMVGDQRGSGHSPFGPTTEQPVGMRHAVKDSPDATTTACGLPVEGLHRLTTVAWSARYQACPKCKDVLQGDSA
jgi:hypothetical protein